MIIHASEKEGREEDHKEESREESCKEEGSEEEEKVRNSPRMKSGDFFFKKIDRFVRSIFYLSYSL